MEFKFDYEAFAKIAEIRNIFVENEKTFEAHQDIYNYVRASGKLSQGSCMSLTGASGAGKTAFIENFIMRNPELNILRVEVPFSCSVKALTQCILESLNDVAYNNTRATEVLLSLRVKKYLTAREIDFIIFDEAQHLIKGKNISKENKIIKEKDKQTIYELSDWLKSGIDRWKIPVLFSGTEDLNLVLSANDQLDRRVKARLSFDQDERKDKVARADWSHFLDVISRKLPFPEESNLAEPKMARALWIGSSRLRGKAVRLIERGASFSFKNRDTHLTPSSLSKAFIELANETEKSVGNPFLEGTN